MSCPVAGFCFYCFHQMSLWVGVEALQTDPLSEADNLQLLVTGGGGRGCCSPMSGWGAPCWMDAKRAGEPFKGSTEGERLTADIGLLGGGGVGEARCGPGELQLRPEASLLLDPLMSSRFWGFAAPTRRPSRLAGLQHRVFNLLFLICAQLPTESSLSAWAPGHGGRSRPP